MAWQWARRNDVTVLITPGYLPDRSRIDAAGARHFSGSDEVPAIPSAQPEAAAWLLSSLARRHLGSYFHAKQRQSDMTVDTWVMDQPTESEDVLGDWFRLKSAQKEDFCLYFHAYPIRQVQRKVLTNLFAYPHKQIGTRRGRHAGERGLHAKTQPLLELAAEQYVGGGHTAVSELLAARGRVAYSGGFPAR